MNKTILKLNKYLAVLILSVMIFGANMSFAQAAIFDWFLNTENKSTTSSVFSYVSWYLNPENQIITDDKQGNELPIVNSNSVVSIGSPVVLKKAVVSVSAKSITNVTREMEVSATAYSSTPDQTDDSPFITASGTYVRDGIVAANFLPFGTKIKIPEIYGDKIFVVEDRMNKRYWHKVDIWFPDRQSALEFGLKTIRIQIIES